MKVCPGVHRVSLTDKGYYSFDVGSAHILMMDTELDCGPDSDQYRFFESDLKAVDRNKTPWVIFAGMFLLFKPAQRPSRSSTDLLHSC